MKATYRIITRFALLSTSLLIGSVTFCNEGRAQQPVVFVPGLGESWWFWDPMAGDMAARLPLTPLKPALGSDSFYETQAAQLRDYLTGQGVNGIAAISHSNGGVVAREYARANGSPRINRHLTLGTPHQGALLAERIQDGTVPAWAADVIWSIVAAVGYYALNDPDWWDVSFENGGDAFYLQDASYSVADLLDSPWFPSALSNLGYLLDANWNIYPEVLPEMWPGSSFFTTLNSSASLSSEAQKLPGARVSISTQYPLYLMPYRAFTFDDWGAWSWWFMVNDVISMAWDAYWYYESHWNWDLRANAWRWEYMAETLMYIPVNWQLFIGAGDSDQSDGIVPWSSSDYPGGTRVRRLYCSQLCLYHVAQLDPVPNPDADAFRLMVNDAARTDLGIVQPPPPPPPPPSLSVGITGPTSVKPDTYCTWSATVSGGTPPYSYSWTQNSMPVGSDSWVDVYTGTSNFSLSVTVTDGAGSWGSAQGSVTVTSGAPMCQM